MHVLRVYERTVGGEAQALSERLKQASSGALRTKWGDKGGVRWEAISAAGFLAYFVRMRLGLAMIGEFSPGPREDTSSVVLTLAVPTITTQVFFVFAGAFVALAIWCPSWPVAIVALIQILFWALCFVLARKGATDFIERRLLPELERRSV
jgi:hypothetical protein